MSDEKFEQVKAGVIKEFSAECVTTTKTLLYWSEISSPHSHIFDRSKKDRSFWNCFYSSLSLDKRIAEEVKKIKKEEIVALFEKYMNPSSPFRRVLVVRLYGSYVPNGIEEKEGHIVIKDLRKWKRERRLMPKMIDYESKIPLL